MIPSVGQNRRFCSNWSRWNKLPLIALMQITDTEQNDERRFHTSSGSPILLLSI